MEPKEILGKGAFVGVGSRVIIWEGSGASNVVVMFHCGRTVLGTWYYFILSGLVAIVHHESVNFIVRSGF